MPILFNHVLAGLLTCPALAVRVETGRVGDIQQNQEGEGWCNPFSHTPPKDYHFEFSAPGIEVMMTFERTPTTTKLHFEKGHWNVWKPSHMETPTADDIIWDEVKPSLLTPSWTVDLQNLQSIVRKSGSPDNVGLQWQNGVFTPLIGGAYYDLDKTVDFAGSNTEDNVAAISQHMERRVGGRAQKTMQMLGIPAVNMSLGSSAVPTESLTGLLHLAGAAASMDVVGMMKGGIQTITGLAHFRSSHVTAANKLFQKLACHPLFKECQAKGHDVLVPLNGTCPQTDSKGYPMLPGMTGPSDFSWVHDTARCPHAVHSMQHLPPTHESSYDIITGMLGAPAGSNTSCFYQPDMPMIPQDSMFPWYKIWCDISTGVWGLTSFMDESCSSEGYIHDKYKNALQMPSKICSAGPLGVLAMHRCAAA